jgi:hypothetical protein
MKRALPYLALLVCLGFAYLGYLSATRIGYYYKHSTWFRSLGNQAAGQLRATTNTTLGIEFSNLAIQNTPLSIQYNLDILAKIRSQAPQELWPIVDLRVAKDYAMLARLEEQSGNLTVAAEHLGSAQALLRSLGWKDVSDDAVTKLADQQLRSRLKR